MGGTGVKLKPASKGAAYIADFLVQQKVPYVFGLCGHGDLGMLDGLYDRQTEIKMISVHHEAIAAFMADGYFRIKQKPVATLSSCGPGSANMVAAIAGAFADSSAMLLITGNVPTTQWNRGPFQESGRFFQGDFITVLRSYVKRSFQPTRGEMLPLAMRQAFALMTNGRPGPVHLDVPLNLFVEPVDEGAAAREADWPTLDWKRPAGDPAAIAQAAKLLLEAERPVIVVGHGVELSNAEAALLAFAEAFYDSGGDHAVWQGNLRREASAPPGSDRAQRPIDGQWRLPQCGRDPGARHALRRPRHQRLVAGNDLQLPADQADSRRHRCQRDRPQLPAGNRDHWRCPTGPGTATCLQGRCRFTARPLVQPNRRLAEEVGSGNRGGEELRMRFPLLLRASLPTCAGWCRTMASCSPTWVVITTGWSRIGRRASRAPSCRPGASPRWALEWPADSAPSWQRRIVRSFPSAATAASPCGRAPC